MTIIWDTDNGRFERLCFMQDVCVGICVIHCFVCSMLAQISMFTGACVRARARARVCVCVRERERERERKSIFTFNTDKLCVFRNMGDHYVGHRQWKV